ncbi:MAG: hypothetical protein IIA19_07360, partial [Thaumarchaeota archaeon]|nr:hypothetical protein [Nitrososphaerota archaeon]
VTDSDGNPGFYSITISTSQDDEGSGGCEADCTPPTLGVDKDGRRLVENGFTYNENSMNVELFYTPYPLITVDVGIENTAVFKIYENNGPEDIRHFEFAFGLFEGQYISQSQAVIIWDKSWDGQETVTLEDPDNVLENVRVLSSIGKCTMESNKEDCLVLTIFHTFREPLEFDMVGSNVWDEKRNGWQNYYNHGIHIEGESLNPMNTMMIPSTVKYEGLIKVTQNERYSNYWTTDDGRIFEMNSFGSFKQINISFERFQDTGEPRTRLHSGFAELIAYEQERATAIFDASQLISELPDYIPYSPPQISERMSEEMKQKMLEQEQIAKKILEAERTVKVLDASELLEDYSR